MNENPHRWFVLPDGERARERVDGRLVRRIVVRGESAEVLRVKKGKVVGVMIEERSVPITVRSAKEADVLSSSTEEVKDIVPMWSVLSVLGRNSSITFVRRVLFRWNTTADSCPNARVLCCDEPPSKKMTGVSEEAQSMNVVPSMEREEEECS